MMSDLLERLQSWYGCHCDGKWEHFYGVRIDTLDNPGWKVVIDLPLPAYKEKSFSEVKVDRSETDWYFCEVKENAFCGAGGSMNLIDILKTFLDFVEE